MTKICYKYKKFYGKNQILIQKAEEIINEYSSDGYTLLQAKQKSRIVEVAEEFY